jgi:hypothetical protein
MAAPEEAPREDTPRDERKPPPRVTTKERRRRDPIGAMEELADFVPDDTSLRQNSYYTLVYATVARSAQTYRSICALLRDQNPVQAGMLIEPLLKDVIVARWLEHNERDPAWLVERFRRHRDEVAPWMKSMERDTGLRIELSDEGSTKAWWDPGEDGKGNGQGVGLSGIARRLEKKSPGLDRMTREWLDQLAQPSAVGLPFIPAGKDATEEPADQTIRVGFNAAWLFAQQVYLIAEFNHLPKEQIDEIDAVWLPCLEGFAEALGDRTTVKRLLDLWKGL